MYSVTDADDGNLIHLALQYIKYINLYTCICEVKRISAVKKCLNM